jgi:hypothetical protein
MLIIIRNTYFYFYIINLLGHSDLVQLFLYSGFSPEQKDKMGQVKIEFVFCRTYFVIDILK